MTQAPVSAMGSLVVPAAREFLDGAHFTFSDGVHELTFAFVRSAASTTDPSTTDINIGDDAAAAMKTARTTVAINEKSASGFRVQAMRADPSVVRLVNRANGARGSVPIHLGPHLASMFTEYPVCPASSPMTALLSGSWDSNKLHRDESQPVLVASGCS